MTNTLHGNMLTFRDTIEEFELKGDLLKMITNKTIISTLLGYRIKN